MTVCDGLNKLIRQLGVEGSANTTVSYKLISLIIHGLTTEPNLLLV